MPRRPGPRRPRLRREDGGAHPGRPARAGRARPFAAAAPRRRRGRAGRSRSRAGCRVSSASRSRARLRRRHETVDRLEVVAGSRDPARALERAVRLPQSRGVLREGPQSITFLLAGDVTLDVARGRPRRVRRRLAVAHGRRRARPRSWPSAPRRAASRSARRGSAAASTSRTRQRSTPRWDCPTSRPSCARARARSPRRSAGSCRRCSGARTSWAPCTATRTPPTGATTCCAWRGRRTRSACAT